MNPESPTQPNTIEDEEFIRSLEMATKSSSKGEAMSSPEPESEPKLITTPEQQTELKTLIDQYAQEPDSTKKLNLMLELKERVNEIKKEQTEKTEVLLPPQELEKDKRYRVIVNPDLEEAIEEGKYFIKDDRINFKNFPPESFESKNRNIEVELIYLNKEASTKEVLNILDENGLRPATIRELLALGSQFPDLQQKFPIPALGSFSKSDKIVAYIGNDVENQRRLNLFDIYNYKWFAYSHFLAVKKEEKK